MEREQQRSGTTKPVCATSITVQFCHAFEQQKKYQEAGAVLQKVTKMSRGETYKFSKWDDSVVYMKVRECVCVCVHIRSLERCWLLVRGALGRTKPHAH